MDERDAKLANLIVNYSIGVKPLDKVILRGETAAEPLLREIYIKVLEAGGHPVLWPDFGWTQGTFLKMSNEDQLTFLAEPNTIIYETFDCMIRVVADENTKSLSSIDPGKFSRFQRSRSPIMKTYMERAAKGELRWAAHPLPHQRLCPGRGYVSGGIRAILSTTPACLI